jgi:septum formation protein
MNHLLINTKIPQPFILASSSAARQSVLRNHAIEFTAIESNIDEKSYYESDPLQRVQLLAREKAKQVSIKNPEAWICGCDTILLTNRGELLEKPSDAIDAERMIRLQSGQCSRIYTGMCLIAPESISKNDKVFTEDIAVASMNFRPLSEDDIQWWLTTQDWAGAAGAFRSQCQGRLLLSFKGDSGLLDGFSVICLLKLFSAAS